MLSDNAKKLMEINGVLETEYAYRVSEYFRERYSQNAVEAIINNYLGEPNNSAYVAEFKEMQAFRTECKAKARAEVYGE